MAGPHEMRPRWRPDEDRKLLECKSRHPNLSWPNIASLAGLERTGKSCRERWTNCLNPEINRGDFSPAEDSIIMEQYLLHGNKWAFIATHLPGRTDTAIKNRFKNHLKKNLAASTHENILVNHNIPNASSNFTSEPKSLIAGFGLVDPTVVNPNETNLDFCGEYIEPWISGPVSASVEAFMPTEEVTRNWSP